MPSFISKKVQFFFRNIYIKAKKGMLQRNLETYEVIEQIWNENESNIEESQ